MTPVLLFVLVQQPVLVPGPPSAAAEQAAGRAMAAELRQRLRPFDDAAVQTYVEKLGARLTAPLSRTYAFVAVHGEDHREPVPVAGGTVFVPVRALLTVQHEDELAGLLAHAIAHVEAGPQRLTAGFRSHAETSRAESLLIPLAFRQQQRDAELAADRAGLTLAARAGFDASAYRRYVAREQPDEESTRSPIPEKELRLQRIDEALMKLPKTAAADSDEFIRLQGTLRVRLSTARQRPVPTLQRPGR